MTQIDESEQTERKDEGETREDEEEETQLQEWFLSVDTDESGKISAKELRGALMNGDWTPFDMETVKMLMTIYDTERSGCLEYEEFVNLCKYIKHWQVVFDDFDKDTSGAIDNSELENAMLRLGYKLGPKALSLLQTKYAVEPKNSTSAGENPVLTFDRFLRCCVAVKTFSQTFESLDTAHEGYVKLDYDTFMYTFLAAP